MGATLFQKEAATMFSIKDRIANSIKGKSWPTYDGKQLDRSQYLTASESTICERRLAFEKRHPEVMAAPQEEWGYAERGNAYEAWAVDRLADSLEKGREWLLYAGKDQVSFYDDQDRISGTPDGVFVSYTSAYDSVVKDAVLMDFKSYDPRKSTSNLPAPAHVSQVNINIALIRKLKIRGLEELKSGIVSYGNASNFQEHFEYPLDFDPSYYERAVEKAKRVLSTNDISALEPEGLSNGDCRYCLFKKQCSAMIGTDVDAASREAQKPMDMPEIKPAAIPRTMKGKIRRFVDNKQQIKLLEMENKKLDEDVRKFVTDNGGSATVGKATIEVSQHPGRETLDRKAMEADGLDVAKYVKTGKPYSRMDVKFQ